MCKKERESHSKQQKKHIEKCYVMVVVSERDLLGADQFGKSTNKQFKTKTTIPRELTCQSNGI